MEYIVICLLFYAALVFLELVPGFKTKQKKTVIFTISVMGAALVVDILNAFNVQIVDPSHYIEKVISAIFKV